jgi:3-hydroxyacyl-CoA dehydrogenase
MGAQIAAHLANVGVPTLLLDVTAEAAAEGLKRARGLKPDPFFTPDTASLIQTASFDDGLASIAGADWIVEAIVERLDVKRALFERLEPHRAPNAIVSSNTSGIPIAALAEGRSAGFRRHFLGTHFFNPPRYLPLLEVIPTADSDPSVVDAISRFADHRLGKGVVVARDTPNFIANHIGLFGVLQILHQLGGQTGVRPGSDRGQTGVRAESDPGLTPEEVDAITGRAIGRPKSATFRTMDIAGISSTTWRSGWRTSRTGRRSPCRRSSKRSSRADRSARRLAKASTRRTRRARS